MSGSQSPGGPGGAELLELIGRERAVTDLLYRYCDLVDANRQAEVVELFTADAVYDHGHGRVYAGHAALAELFGALTGNSATSHHLSNVRFVHLESGMIACNSYVYAYHRRATSGDEVHLWGRYDDLVAQRDGEWRFVRRALLGAAERGVEPDAGWSSRYALPFRVGRDELR
jgi:3-phenylpropionate/cinnamic acid dioxygenase small subunit